MEVRVAVQLLALLLLGICAGGADAQVACYSSLMCPMVDKIGEYSSYQACCILEDSISWETGSEPCTECLTYGWKDDFPIEVRKGQELTLTIGYLKGDPPSRVIFEVDFNSSEVNLDMTSITLGTDDVLVRVTVVDDSQPVLEDKIINITLRRTFGGATTDALITEATLIIRAQEEMIPVMVGFNSTAVTATESEGRAIACVSTTSPNSDTVSVSISAIAGTATELDDFLPPFPPTLQLTANSTRCVEVSLIARDGYENSETLSLLLTTSDANVDIVRNVTEVTILDSDEAYIILSPDSETVVEGDGEVKRLCLSINSSAVDVTVSFPDNDLLASDVEEVEMFEREIVLPASGSPVCIQYMIIDDDEIEGTEVITVTLMGAEPRVVPATFMLTIEDNDMLPPSPSPSPPPPSPSPSPLPPSPSPLPPTTETPPTVTPTRLLSLPENIADTVSGGAFFATLINAHSTDTDSAMEMALCYEIHGEQDEYFNLISEPCLSVNAHYMLQDPDKPLHFIDEIAVVATNAEGNSVNMRIDRDCNLLVDGSTTNTEFLNSSRVLAESIPAFSDVVMETDSVSCSGEKKATRMVVKCAADPHGLMQLDVSRDLAVVNSSSHGLLGQFWGRPIPVSNYGEAPHDYLIKIPLHGNQEQRQIVGSSHGVTWEYRRLKCLYLGDRQGGRGAGLHGGPNEPLIDGEYIDYLTSGPFDTNFKYSQFRQ